MRTLRVLLLGLLLGAVLGYMVRGSDTPTCAEDEIIQGVGDFEDGRWTAYVCGHDGR